MDDSFHYIQLNLLDKGPLWIRRLPRYWESQSQQVKSIQMTCDLSTKTINKKLLPVTKNSHVNKILMFQSPKLIEILST